MARLLLVLAAIASANGRVHGGLSAAPRQNEQSVRVGVLGLFHPREVVIRATERDAIVLRCGNRTLVLENSAVSTATLRVEGPEVVVMSGAQLLRANEIQVSGRAGQPVYFILDIPGKITRRYNGSLDASPASGQLSAILTLNLETAVASVVAAENASDTPLEALKANAIAARSYLVSARGRHREFDFCDTTHCQFLRNPPSSESRAAQATAATRGMVLAYRGRPFTAMYTRSCSGSTRTPADLGLSDGAYPYYSVACTHCRIHPAIWHSSISARDAAQLRPGNEPIRLAVDHRLGWSAVQSNDFSVARKGDVLLLSGVGNGHGIGLCQSGARAMAKAGASFQQILYHYYPNTNVVSYSDTVQR